MNLLADSWKKDMNILILQPSDYEECDGWGVDSSGVQHEPNSAGEEVTKPSAESESTDVEELMQ